MATMARHEKVLIALRRIIRATDLYSRKLSKEAGLTAPQLLILHALQCRGELTMGEIADEVTLSQGTITTILDRLEKRGLLHRERGSSDKRRVYAHISTRGRELLAQAPAPLQQEFMHRFQQLDEREQSGILGALEKVAAMMNAGDIDASPVLDVGAIDRSQPAIHLGESSGSARTSEARRK